MITVKLVMFVYLDEIYIVVYKSIVVLSFICIKRHIHKQINIAPKLISFKNLQFKLHNSYKNHQNWCSLNNYNQFDNILDYLFYLTYLMF